MSSSDEFFDAESEDEAPKTVEPRTPVQKPPRPPPPDLSRQRSQPPRPSTLPLDFRIGKTSPFSQFEKVQDDALLTPNSTIDCITASFTKEMIFRQNRQKSQKLSNGDSFENISNEAISVSKSSSLEREQSSVDAIEAQKRSSMDYSDEARTKSRYFSCSELLNELETKNPGLKRDDSIRSSIKSNSRHVTPHRPNSACLVPPHMPQIIPPLVPPSLNLSTEISSKTLPDEFQTSEIFEGRFVKSPFEISRSQTDNEIITSGIKSAYFFAVFGFF
jgi:hypothetical protein